MNILRHLLIVFSISFYHIAVSDLKELRTDRNVTDVNNQDQHLTAMIDWPKKIWINEQLEQLIRILSKSNSTMVLPNSMISEITRCMRCAKSFFLALRATLVSGNHFERFVNICNRLRGIVQCTSHVPGKCSKIIAVEYLLNSFQYFCMDHFSGYKYIFECLDLHSSVVSLQCQAKCEATRHVAGWFIYSYIHSILPFSIPEKNGPAKINKQFFEKISSDFCSIVSCHLDCLREKYNKRCNNIGGDMFLEVLFRPLVSLHKSWTYSPIATLMMLIMPQTCEFLTNLDKLNAYRLDEKKYAKISQTFPKSAQNHYSNHLQAQSTSWVTPLKSIQSSSLLENIFSSNSTEFTDTDILHVKEIDKVIEEFKAIDKMQKFNLSSSL